MDLPILETVTYRFGAVRHREAPDRLSNPESSGSEARGAACIRNIAATGVRTATSARIVDVDIIVRVGAVVIDSHINVPARDRGVPTHARIPLISVVYGGITRFPAWPHNLYAGRSGASGWSPSPASVKPLAGRGAGCRGGVVARVC